MWIDGMNIKRNEIKSMKKKSEIKWSENESYSTDKVN